MITFVGAVMLFILCSATASSSHAMSEILHSKSAKGATVTVNSGATFQVNPGATVGFSDGSSVTVDGDFKAIGATGNLANITHISTGYYTFTVNATIAANYALFEYMGGDGINVTSSGTIDATDCFHNCTFRYGETGVSTSLLTVQNSQTIDPIQNVTFESAKAATYNVTKTTYDGVDESYINFEPWVGAFGDEPNDNDHYPGSFNEVRWDGGPVGVEEEQSDRSPEETPLDYVEFGIRTSKSGPNPFTDYTTIAYGVDKPGLVSLKIYDITGRVVKSLIDGKTGRGIYQVRWDGTDDAGRKVSIGIYFLRLSQESRVSTRKLVAIK